MRKFLSVLLCAVSLFLAVACTPTPPAGEPQKTYDEQKALYADIISKYTDLLTAKYNGEALPAPGTADMGEQEASIAEALYGIVDACKNADAVEGRGYGFKDMDGNGTPELILLDKYTSVDAIFTLLDNTPILLEAVYGEGNYITFGTKKRFYITRDAVVDNIRKSTYYICRVDGDKMAYDSVYGEVYDQEKEEAVERFQMVEGDRMLIDQDTFTELHREYTKSLQPDYTGITKMAAPLIHFPLEKDATDENLPIADFSSYTSIRETYQLIATCLDKFHIFDWFMGEYDRLFSFPSDLSFEYYTRLLYAAYQGGKHHVGYDEIDLNGDGQDELVLLCDDYRIKAIFTQKDGQPVLLDAFAAYQTCWLDDQGFIHVDREELYELEYSVYELTKSADYHLVYSVLATNTGRYLTKDGKTEQITFEESLKIYHDDYCRYSEPFEPNEYTRNVSSLFYTPMAEPAEDLAEAACGKTWRKFADLEKTAGNEYGAYSNTYVTFEDIRDGQIDINFKYAFTTFYPDPNRDHYLLDETTESFLLVTAHEENGVLVFAEHGLKGRVEFGLKHMWIIIEESTDQRFPVGHHCYEEYSL